MTSLFERILKRCLRFWKRRSTTQIAVWSDLRRLRPVIGQGTADAAPSESVLLAPPGAGNIGDQAMVEAYLDLTRGPVTLIVRHPGDVFVREEDADRVAIVAMPWLVYGDGAARRADLERFRDLMAQASDFAIVGADVMDGKYSPRASVRRAILAVAAARAGVPTRILGFSYNARPERTARAALRRAAAAGATLLVRDPVSAARARRDGITVTDAADIVFTARDTAAPAGIALAGDAPLVVCNVSSLLARSVRQTEEYAAVLRHALGRGCRVLLVPHVIRENTDDLVECAAVRDAVADPNVFLVERSLTPAEIRCVAAAADVVITGRMHLAVMALNAGTPAIALATQGKVEGLFALVDAPELCVLPEAGMRDRLTILLDRLLDDPIDVVARVSGRLPAVRELAARNRPGCLPEAGRAAADPVSGREEVAR